MKISSLMVKVFYLNGQINKRLGPDHVTVYKAVSDIHSIKIKTSSLLRTRSLGSGETNREILITNQLAFYLLNTNSIICYYIPLYSTLYYIQKLSVQIQSLLRVDTLKSLISKVILNFWRLLMNEKYLDK